MRRMVARTMGSASTWAVDFISPATRAKSVVTRVSQATLEVGSWRRYSSRMASEIWSATLSGWPSETDSEVNRYGIESGKERSRKNANRPPGRSWRAGVAQNYGNQPKGRPPFRNQSAYSENKRLKSSGIMLLASDMKTAAGPFSNPIGEGLA